MCCKVKITAPWPDCWKVAFKDLAFDVGPGPVLSSSGTSTVRRVLFGHIGEGSDQPPAAGPSD